MPPLPTRRFDILLIEDNAADVALTTAAFRDALVDARLHIVQDGEEAMAFLRHTGAECPDLVVLDLSLPGGSGFDVLEEMKADPKLKSIPVVVMSGSDRAADQARAYRLQAGAYIVKPADKDKYFDAIRSIKELWFHTITPVPKENDASV
jgi:CheY-like chemotaxis protein